MQKEIVGPKEFLHITVEWTFKSQNGLERTFNEHPAPTPPVVGMDTFQQIRRS